MSKRHAVLAAMIVASPALAQDTRELDAHEHGVSELNLAFAGNQIAVELHAPGFDIVGFEYVAESDEDQATVRAALATLGDPLALFQIPEAAGCSVTAVDVILVQGAEHGDDHDHDHDHEEQAEGEAHEHDHEEQAEGEAHDHDHEEHAEGETHDHGHEEQAEGEAHDHDHGHEEHAEGEAHDHDHVHEEHAEGEAHDHDHDHEEQADGAVHSEFEAEYLLTCTDVTAIDSITMAFFDQFDTAQELEVVVFTTSGAQSFEVDRDAPVLDLSDAL